MSYNPTFSHKIFEFPFHKKLTALAFQESKNVNDKVSWPLVYIISNKSIKQAYIGETTDVFTRISNHLGDLKKKELEKLHLITSDQFNKSATLDIESRLIRYMSADGVYKPKNGNLGIMDHEYYDDKKYSELFKKIWINLRKQDLAKHHLSEIDNSNLFKYSPFKKLFPDQVRALSRILEIISDGKEKCIVVEGGAGTGKTILATYLIKLLNTSIDDLLDFDRRNYDKKIIKYIKQVKKNFSEPDIALVIAMTALRSTLEDVFRNTNGLRRDMVISPASLSRKKYDILIIDEAHRLKRRLNLGADIGSFDSVNKKLRLGKESGTQLDWILKRSKIQIIFYDKAQSIKPSDIPEAVFLKLVSKAKQEKSFVSLQSQLRVKGGKDYIDYVDKLLNCTLSGKNKMFKSSAYEFEFFDSLKSLINKLNKQEKKHGLARLVAGYSWEWKSDRDKSKFDINIEKIKLKWNKKNERNWIHSDNAKELKEVGCIHTTQGYDLNYAGVIFGNEITYNPFKNCIEVNKKNYHDKKGKQGIEDIEDLKQYIINIYKTLMFRGMHGTYVYVCDKNLRDYFKKHVSIFKTEKAIKIIPLNETNPFRIIPLNEVEPFINSVPLYDINIAAGGFSALQQASDFKWVELPKPYIAKEEYFVCKIVGESMDKKIPNGSWCLFQKDPGGSREEKIVLVEHRNINDKDFGAGYTVKSYHSTKAVNEDSWSHMTITLKPLSTDSKYKDIILNEDELSELKVVGIFVAVL